MKSALECVRLKETIYVSKVETTNNKERLKALHWTGDF
jgi:hypothetical protein